MIDLNDTTRFPYAATEMLCFAVEYANRLGFSGDDAVIGLHNSRGAARVTHTVFGVSIGFSVRYIGGGLVHQILADVTMSNGTIAEILLHAGSDVPTLAQLSAAYDRELADLTANGIDIGSDFDEVLIFPA